jgi:hypothetical protein
MSTRTGLALKCALLVIGFVALTGCGASSEPSLVTAGEDVVGVWRAVHGQAYIEFTEDGTLRTDRFGMYGSLEGEPNRTNEFWVEGSEIFVKELKTHGVASCGDTVGTYEIELLADGNLSFGLVEDGCEDRVEMLLIDEYERFEPEQ